MSSELPYLQVDERILFPTGDKATEEGIVAAGGNLSPGMLLSAYTQGCFPWFNEGEPVLWWNPDPRLVFYPHKVHLSRRTQRKIKNSEFEFSIDCSFTQVMENCATAGRRSEEGSWITSDFINAYHELFRLGYAHSIEVWHQQKLVGGLYGVASGSVFCGESMFSLMSEASKAALFILSLLTKDKRIELIDCQMETPHLISLGAETLSRNQFLTVLKGGCDAAGYSPESWNYTRRPLDIFSSELMIEKKEEVQIV